MNSKLLKLKKDISKLKPGKEDIQGQQLKELLEAAREGKKPFKEFLEGVKMIL